MTKCVCLCCFYLGLGKVAGGQCLKSVQWGNAEIAQLFSTEALADAAQISYLGLVQHGNTPPCLPYKTEIVFDHWSQAVNIFLDSDVVHILAFKTSCVCMYLQNFCFECSQLFCGVVGYLSQCWHSIFKSLHSHFTELWGSPVYIPLFEVLNISDRGLY